MLVAHKLGMNVSLLCAVRAAFSSDMDHVLPVC